MNSQPEIEFLLRLTDFGIKLGLEKTFHLLDKFGNPHTKYQSILIAGTNGKGSVSKSLATILNEAGYKTGLYTSPHLVDIKERISIGGENIQEEVFINKIRELQGILKNEPEHLTPTFFEAMTVVAFSLFSDFKIDILVCEVGLGGRFDATNVLPSFLEIITKIGFDHIKFLGKTYPEIANEKSGIIKEGSIVVTSSQHKEVLDVITDKAREKKSKLYVHLKDFKSIKKSVTQDGQSFNFYGSKKYTNIFTPLLGKHQIENMSLVLQAVSLMQNKGFPMSNESIYGGLRKVKWPCRVQVLKKEPLLILDGAHNLDGMKTLLNSLKNIFPKEKWSFLIGILKDKEWQKMLQALQRFKNIETIVFTKTETDRAAEPQMLASYIKREDIRIIVMPDYQKAYRYTEKHTGNWCICGSLYLCGNILPLTEKKPLYTK
ncbi:bifunctional folylpolyglutamate synthase/dihydrofolate synthase [bacterium]|nr:bifunctional folylpolyglutamate synthase/dihydrofolate synthase [bacterium]